jgi:cobalt-precorrin-5B (C1)-methyltransferase
LAGGFAKIAKLAQGHLDLHSGSSRVAVAELSTLLADLGAPQEAVEAARNASGAGEVLSIARQLGEPLADALGRRIAAQARDVAMAQLAGQIAVDVAIFDRFGKLTGHAGP